MNLKSIQRGYEHLTMLERLSLADQAVARDDESEIKAIVAASLRVTYSQPDYSELFENINRGRFCVLITRLSYIMQFDVFLCLLFNQDKEELPDVARLVAYLYVRATDAWVSVCEEFGLRPDFNERVSNNLFSVETLEMKDSLLRESAFTESEAQAYIEKQGGEGKIQTLADEIKATREALGLPQS